MDDFFFSFKLLFKNFIHFVFQVYKYVLSDGKKDYIIAFYNKEFHQEMKEYILATFGNKNKVCMFFFGF